MEMDELPEESVQHVNAFPSACESRAFLLTPPLRPKDTVTHVVGVNQKQFRTIRHLPPSLLRLDYQ